MHLQARVLSAAVLAALVVAAPAQAGRFDGHSSAIRAKGMVDIHPSSTRRADGDVFSAKDVVIDSNGTEHVRLERTHRGLPMIGGDLVVHARNGKLLGISQTLRSAARPDMTARISGDEATITAGVDFGTRFDGVKAARKVVFALNMTPRLAYEVVFTGTKRDQTPTEMHYFVDADTGAILNKWDMVHTAKPGGGGGSGGSPAVGTGRTLMYGNVSLNTASSGSSFNLTDTTRGSGAVYDANGAAYSTAANRATLFTDADNTWGNNTTSDRATVAADAHYGVATTWDYYKNTHGRNGIFNDGKGVKSYVHVGRNWVNAAWYANAMYYGDGGGSYLPLVSLDIAGHEMSHGVTQATSGLVYSGDAGGLNEATSDIFGAMVEFYANNPNDPADYRIGEEIYTNGTSALRYMYDPNLDGNASYDCYPSAGFGGVDPHYSSVPSNHFFYLLAEGTGALSKTCNAGDTKNATGSGSLNGIGRSAAEKIWYRALDIYFTSGTSYPQARAHTLSAAADLYGAGSAQYNAVAATWAAINVN